MVLHFRYMKQYKTFDWKQSVEMHTPAGVNLLWNTHDIVISEEDWVKQYKERPHDHRRAWKCRAKAKRQYAHLKDNYGFFTGRVSYRKS